MSGPAAGDVPVGADQAAPMSAPGLRPGALLAIWDRTVLRPQLAQAAPSLVLVC